jgi:hypothetical protein
VPWLADLNSPSAKSKTDHPPGASEGLSGRKEGAPNVLPTVPFAGISLTAQSFPF